MALGQLMVYSFLNQPLEGTERRTEGGGEGKGRQGGKRREERRREEDRKKAKEGKEREARRVAELLSCQKEETFFCSPFS